MHIHNPNLNVKNKKYLYPRQTHPAGVFTTRELFGPRHVTLPPGHLAYFWHVRFPSCGFTTPTFWAWLELFHIPPPYVY